MSGPATSGFAARTVSFVNHPAGPKTIFFWGPFMRWCLVGASLKDLTRPADKLSISQNFALSAAGFISARWSFVIIHSFAAANFFVGLSGVAQLARIAHYCYTQQPVAQGTSR
ncbi:Mitochondrial pyruvate carrier [Mycena sanguinolenta]|uniref:Mitochondrial pyruvate carrier n=1 Tax=Mycena sanguinolenta TaxID=230812 RepID=A0A8H6ZLF2_9AGAR|nr:Mitochondrial pyruvate carrier [Mycena sanguinolenta]